MHEQELLKTKNKQSEEIRRQTEDFIRRGGTIEHVAIKKIEVKKSELSNGNANRVAERKEKEKLAKKLNHKGKTYKEISQILGVKIDRIKFYIDGPVEKKETKQAEKPKKVKRLSRNEVREEKKRLAYELYKSGYTYKAIGDLIDRSDETVRLYIEECRAPATC